MDAAYWESLFSIKDPKEFNIWYSWAVFYETGQIIGEDGQVIKDLSTDTSPYPSVSPPSSIDSSSHLQPARAMQPIPRSTTPEGEPPYPNPFAPRVTASKASKGPKIVGWTEDYGRSNSPSSSGPIKKRSSEQASQDGKVQPEKRARLTEKDTNSRAPSSAKASISPPSAYGHPIPNDRKQPMPLATARAIADWSRFMASYQRV